MSHYDLLPDEAFDNAPEEDSDKFVFLARAAQKNLQRMLDDSQAGYFADDVKAHFIATVLSLADTLDIRGMPGVSAPYNESDYSKVQVALSGMLVKARLRNNLLAKPHSVQLGTVTREKIRLEVEQLRVYIEEASLSDAKKQALNDKLDELLAELEHRRLSFARTMAIAASIMGVVGGSAGAIAAAPKIPAGVSFIVSLIGLDKAQEDEEQLRLAPPPKALFGPSTKVPSNRFADDLDDDVPF
ncbi:hypothetical protein KCP91_08060 [Microvirga sp. SRT01]|uniref:Uncharacterized protein n=1 Tax=Sphingomonas longa TaxID=2778730 RepID=A0ABS2D5X9_9SPHN|nr:MULTISPECIES: hypothetical protein [Alphaproteobacteria]MBM6576324.1 hypothetical protein [Sphingomonas sp. BT552]MBR7709370.1 hypothetical protein [Microvirga sp. SRT01]